MTTGRLLGFCVAALLAACQRQTAATPAATPAVNAANTVAPPPGPTAAEQTAGMVEAVTVGKSTVPVAVKFDLSARPTVGQPLQVSLAVLPRIGADPAVLAVDDSAALQLAPGSAPIEIPAVQPGQVYRQTVTVTPTVDGVLLLGVQVSLKHDEISETRTFSVPVIVAPATGAAPAAPGASMAPGAPAPNVAAGSQGH